MREFSVYKLLDLVEISEQYFDVDKLEKVFGYLPFYNDVLTYCTKLNIKMENIGGSHFDWFAEITQDEVDKYLLMKYSAFILKTK